MDNIEQREFRADPLKLKRLRVAAAITLKDVVDLTDLDKTTVSKIFRGDPVFLKSLSKLVDMVFHISNPLEVLHPIELAAMGVMTDLPTNGRILEWEIEQHLTGWQQTTNGLQFQVARLSHCYLSNRLARGKCYELRHLTQVDRQRAEEYLLRHVEVCEQVGDHPNIAQNLTAAPVDGLWWVLDRWEEGEWLADRIRQGPLSEYELRVIMTGIAQGLAELHAHKIIRRELSPRAVWLREQNDRPILTDMELAKLGEGNRTVAPEEWPEDRYRAPEVTGDAPLDVRVDLFSWGRIFVHGATGKLGDWGTEDLKRLNVPPAVKEVVQQCVSVNRSGRPKDIKSVLKALKGWE